MGADIKGERGGALGLRLQQRQVEAFPATTSHEHVQLMQITVASRVTGVEVHGQSAGSEARGIGVFTAAHHLEPGVNAGGFGGGDQIQE